MTQMEEEYQKAMAVLDDLAKDYENWAMSDLDKLKSIFQEAQNLSDEERTSLLQDKAFRCAHDMKGQGATFRYELVTEIGNHLCRYIEKQESFDQSKMDVIKQHIEALEQILHQHLIDDGGIRGQDLKKKIMEL